MRSEQIILVRKAINLITKHVFPEVNQISEECALAVSEAIKCLSKALDSKAEIDNHSSNSKDFAKKHEQFLKQIMQQIEDRNLVGTIMMQTKHKKEVIDVCMSTMDEERILTAFRSFFIQFGKPEMFLKFLRMMMEEMGGTVHVMPIPIGKIFDKGEDNESDRDMDGDEK